MLHMLSDGKPSEIVALQGMELFEFWMHVWVHHDSLTKKNSANPKEHGRASGRSKVRGGG